MSTSTSHGDAENSPDTTTDPSTDPPSKAERLASYLRSEAADGETYFKAKFIADDVDLSPKEIGALIVQLQESVGDLEIEKWSYTGATTWRVSTR
ncbi:hypothetical protein J2751_000923 [Halorubrum alkaliphilum]|uniref:DUF7123 domain-containing protein n=1 Tax=Halorubrum alkaliphilum TaxID=261290 RepID=A0A8T4GCT1_9EURY|nr:hypothetical protein [Halorubrum alkaliphilum]MBP1921926.1 hypothetical protein [Halorubrum alkaliphilum]